MKICPQCQTKYTDDSLTFCLQDGSSLKIANDEKTLVFDQDSFANDETIAGNFSDKTKDVPKETVAFENKQTDANQKNASNNLSDEYISNPTIIRQREPKTLPPIETKSTNKVGGLGILTGFLGAVFFLGLIGVSLLAIIYLPSMLNGDSNSNSQLTNSNTIKETILNDSNKVKVSASSSRKPEKGNSYKPELAFDGNSRTAWCEGAKGAGKGQWIVFDFDEEVLLNEVIIEPGYFKTEELWRKNNRLSSANFKFSDGTTRSFDFENEMKEQKIDVGSVKTKSVMITIKDIYAGQSDSIDTLISEVKFVVQEN